MLKTLLAALLMTILSLGNASAQDTFYYFSAQEHNKDYQKLKFTFDSYLSRHGEFIMQPFEDKKVFERVLKASTNGVFLLSGEHYHQLRQTTSLSALAIAMTNDSIHNRYMVISQLPAKSDDAIKPNHPKTEQNLRGTIATASSHKLTQNYINKYLTANADSLHILTVPKEIDALLSVSFGIAEFALVSERVYTRFIERSPKLQSRLNVVARTGNQLNLVLCEQGTSALQHALTQIIIDMPTNDPGKKALSLLGIEDWKILSPHDRSYLEGKQ